MQSIISPRQSAYSTGRSRCTERPRSDSPPGTSEFRLPRPTRLILFVLTPLLWGLLASPAPAQEAVAGPILQDGGVIVDAATPDSAEPIQATGIPKSPMEIVSALGYYVIPFLIASVISLWFTIERLVVLRTGRVIPRHFVDRFLHHLEQNKLDSSTALKLCEQSDSPIAAVFAHGIRKWGKPSVEVEQAIIDGGERQVSQLRKHLRVINGVATVTPLLGLLGTVVGMITAFNEIAKGGAMGNATQLASGIALALLTTAIGLAIAIPSLIVYMYLSGRVDRLVMEMDLLAQDVVHLISAEAVGTRTTPISRSVEKPPSRVKGKSKEAG